MKTLWLSLALLSLACSKAQLPLTPETKTILQVKAIDKSGVEVDSVNIFINGESAGYTPFLDANIQTGLLALRLMKTGFQVYTEQLLIEEGQSYNVEAVLESLAPDAGQLVVTVNQDSATVFIKDSRENILIRSQDRASSHMLPQGAYIVAAEKDGLDPVVKAVDILAGQATTVNLEFEVTAEQTISLEFSIAEDSATVGEAINLSWQSSGYQVIIDQGIGLRGPNGSEKTVCLSAGEKIFTATAYGENNMTFAVSDTVYIAAKTEIPPALEFSADPDSLVYGDPVLLNWNSDGYQVVIDQGVGTRGPAGAEEVYFRNPGKKVFTATAYGNDNLLTIRRDSVYIKEAPMPAKPVVMLSTTKKVEVDAQASITWITQNADYVVVDFVQNSGLQGSESVTFSTQGIRIVTATAYNQAGYSSATDTIEVVNSQVASVDDIILSAESSVRADKGQTGYQDLNTVSFEIRTSGRYRFYSEVWYNSGDAQLNESFYLELRDGSGQVTLPANPNAGQVKVVPDDPGTPHTKTQKSGDFQLSAGAFSIDVHHYAQIADRYPTFLNGSIDGPESVKIIGFRIVKID
ncbi:MAG: PEGA domain-containing protein [bacterium]